MSCHHQSLPALALATCQERGFRVDEALRSSRDLLTAQVKGSEARSKLPVIDVALALGRVTGLTGKDEVIWLRACLAALAALGGEPEGRYGD